MLILIDRKMPAVSKEKLQEYGKIVEFATEDITYEAISGHPDIFFCPSPSGLIVAPNLPEKYISKLKENKIRFSFGKLPVGKAYPESARYNSLITDTRIIHHPEISDAGILRLNSEKKPIHVKQGYVRCNLIALPNDSFITSDPGIKKSLQSHHLKVLFVNSSNIALDGFDHGFFGGACGIHNNTLFICGSLGFLKEKEEIKSFTEQAGMQILELYDGPLLDVGTILFLETHKTGK
jgi:hypothetical protein